MTVQSPIDSASATSARASAPPLRAPISPSPIPGSAKLGSPAGTSAITAMPWAGKSNARLQTIAMTVTISAHGTSGAIRRPTSSTASETAPTSVVSQLMLPSSPISRQSISGTLPLSTEMPRSFGSCADDDQDADPADEPDEHRSGKELGDEAEA